MNNKLNRYEIADICQNIIGGMNQDCIRQDLETLAEVHTLPCNIYALTGTDNKGTFTVYVGTVPATEENFSEDWEEYEDYDYDENRQPRVLAITSELPMPVTHEMRTYANCYELYQLHSIRSSRLRALNNYEDVWREAGASQWDIELLRLLINRQIEEENKAMDKIDAKIKALRNNQ